VLRWRTEREHGGDALYDLVSDRAVTLCHPDEILGRVADLMVAADLGRIPVVERDGDRVVGLVARKDLLRLRSVVTAAERDRAAYFGRSPAIASANATPG
jgi:predicted transcriptional regulator